MYGLVPALMDSQRLRNAEEQAAAERAFRERTMAMQEAQHGLAMQEGNLRLEGLRKQRQSIDNAVSAFDADNAPAPGGNLPQQMVAPEGAGFLEANGVNPAPVAASGLARPGMAGLDAASMRAMLQSGNFDGAYKLKDMARARQLEQWKSTRFKELSALSPEELATMAGKFSSSDAPVHFNFDPSNKAQPFQLVPYDSVKDRVPARKLSTTEMVETILGAEMAGNGNFDAGIKLLTEKLTAKRNLEEKDRADSLSLAGKNAEGYFKSREADATDARNVEQGRHNKETEKIQAAQVAVHRAQVQAQIERMPTPLSPADRARIDTLVAGITPTATPKEVNAIHDQVNAIIAVHAARSGVMIPRNVPPKEPVDPMKALEAVQGMTAPARFNPGNNPKLKVSNLPIEAQLQIAREFRDELSGGGGTGGSGGLPATPGVMPAAPPKQGLTAPKNQPPAAQGTGLAPRAQVDDASLVARIRSGGVSSIPAIQEEILGPRPGPRNRAAQPAWDAAAADLTARIRGLMQPGQTN